MPGKNRRLLIVEDEALLASLLEQSLTLLNFQVRTAPDVATAKQVIGKFDPDILLLDIDLGQGPSGLHLAHAVAHTNPGIAILILTQFADAKRANTEGLDVPEGVGFLRKHLVTDADYLITAIESVIANKANEVRQDSAAASPFPQLADKAYQVFKLLAEGYNNAEIAQRTELSAKSVERWIEQIYRTLGINTNTGLNPRVEAARLFYVQQGIPGRK